MRPTDLARRAAGTARLAVLALTPARVLHAQYERRGREVAAYAAAAERGLQASARRRQAEEDGAKPRRGASEHRRAPERRAALAMEVAKVTATVVCDERDEARRQRDDAHATIRAMLPAGEELIAVKAERDRLAGEVHDLREVENQRDALGAELVRVDRALSDAGWPTNDDTAEVVEVALTASGARSTARADARATAERARADRLHAALNDAVRAYGALIARHTVLKVSEITYDADGRPTSARRTWRPQQVPDAVVTEWAAEHDRLGMVARDDAPPVGAETEEART